MCIRDRCSDSGGDYRAVAFAHVARAAAAQAEQAAEGGEAGIDRDRLDSCGEEVGIADEQVWSLQREASSHRGRRGGPPRVMAQVEQFVTHGTRTRAAR